jgi:CMP-N,N'-diacetyllegionaminic acid synthase
MKLNNEIWAFIPARSGSKSIKDKNLVILKKKPLIAHSIIVAKNCNKIDKIVFSSDSKKYFNIAKKYGDFLFHHRNKKISSDQSTDFEVFKDFTRNYKGTLPKFFIHLRPTTPFRDPKILEKIISKFIKNQKKYSSLRSLSLMTNPIYKSVVIKNNKLFSPIFKSFSLDKINKPRQKYPNSYMPNGYVDIIKTKSIFNGFLHGDKSMPYTNKDFVSDIDSYFDLKIANLID